MAELPSESIDAYERQLARFREEARRYVFARFQAARANGLIKNDEDALKVAHDALTEARQAYGDQAARAAADRYDATAEDLGHDVPLAEMDNDFTDDEIWGQVGRAYKASKTSADFIRNVANFAYDKTYNAARKTTARNADRDFYRGMRYARIPTGRETCGWCVMLASRGFVYHSKEKAGDYGGRFNYFHDRCDCRVEAGDENSTVAGYDPDWYLKVYGDAREACGSGDPKDIANEISRRSKMWVYRKQPGRTEREDGAEPMPKELETAKRLSDHGFDVLFRATRSAQGLKTSDIRIGGKRSLKTGLPWEIKQPTGSGKRNISNQFNEASGQARRLILDVTKSPKALDEIEDEVRRQLSLRDDFIEVLVVTDDVIHRFKK